MKEIMDICNTSNVGTLHQQQVQNDWKRLKHEVLCYKSSVPSYKIDTPVYIKNSNYKLRNESGYFVNISLFSEKGLKQIEQNKGFQVQFQIDKLDGNKKATLKKIIEGNKYITEINRINEKLKNENLKPLEKDVLINQLKTTTSVYETLLSKGEVYKQGSAQLKISKKGKIELLMSFTFESVKKDLDYNRILGIDLGIVNVATMSIWDDNYKEYDYISYKQNVMNGNELIAYRQKLYSMGLSEKDIQKEIYKYNLQLHQKQLNKCEVGMINGLEVVKYRETTEKRKRELSIASKYCGNKNDYIFEDDTISGRLGHGRDTKMKPVDKVRNRISNFVDTFNHKYSKYIVNFAIRNNCGTIQMEDLSGFSDQQKDKFLKNWSYYDLQDKIKSKANEVGIVVKFVLPHYTSLRCNSCGFIDYQNRDCKNNQAKFECVKCEHGKIDEKGKGRINADINASTNIALPNIESIILEQLEAQSKLNEKYKKMYDTYKKALSDKDKKKKTA
jgi:IS605 OrfB family transposase